MDKFCLRFFLRIPKQKWTEWIAPRFPPRDRLNFENPSTLAVAMVENLQNGRFFETLPNCQILLDSKDFLACILPIDRPSTCISLIPPILVN